MGSCPMKRRNILASNHNECCKMVLTSESVNENVCCDHSNETLWQYLHKVLFVFQHLKKGNLEILLNKMTLATSASGFYSFLES